MPTPSERLLLAVPSTSDAFVTADIADNWGKIDAAPGQTICTSSGRPDWGAAQAGMTIFETDSGLEWRWNGTTFSRTTASGVLVNAISTATHSTTSTTAVAVVSTGAFNVPAGLRPLLVLLGWVFFGNDTVNVVGSAYFAESNTNNTSITKTWSMGVGGSSLGGYWMPGGTLSYLIPGGVAAGSKNWSFQIATNSGGSTASVINPTITVIEL